MTKREAQLFDGIGSRKYLNSKERMRFHATASSLADPEHRSFALTVFYTGCRISEALALTPSRLDEAEKLIVLRTLKQRTRTKFRAIPIPGELLAALLRQSEGLTGDERLWKFCRTTGWKIIKSCMASSELTGTKATPKGLRHAFAVACVSENIPLPILQRLLGHAHLQTTGIYLELIGEDERELISRIWPDRGASEEFET